MKFKFTLTQVVEFEPNPENYPVDKRTPEGMLEVDLASANDDPDLFFDIGFGGTTEIKGEVIE